MQAVSAGGGGVPARNEEGDGMPFFSPSHRTAPPILEFPILMNPYLGPGPFVRLARYLRAHNGDFSRLREVCPEFDVNAIADDELCISRNYTYLLAACSDNDFEVAKWLIEAGADVSRKDVLQQSVLQLACISEQVNQCSDALVEYLLSIDAVVATVNDMDSMGLTPLLCARDAYIAKRLVECGADVNTPQRDPRGGDGAPPLTRAAIDDNCELVEYLIPLVSSVDEPIRRDLVDEAHLRNVGQTALCFAAVASHDGRAVAALLNAGSDVNVVSENTMTPLLLAAGNNLNPYVCYLLVRAGASLNPPSELTPVQVASTYNRNGEVARYLAYEEACWKQGSVRTRTKPMLC